MKETHDILWPQVREVKTGSKKWKDRQFYIAWRWTSKKAAYFEGALDTAADMLHIKQMIKEGDLTSIWDWDEITMPQQGSEFSILDNHEELVRWWSYKTSIKVHKIFVSIVRRQPQFKKNFELPLLGYIEHSNIPRLYETNKNIRKEEDDASVRAERKSVERNKRKSQTEEKKREEIIKEGNKAQPNMKNIDKPGRKVPAIIEQIGESVDTLEKNGKNRSKASIKEMKEEIRRKERMDTEEEKRISEMKILAKLNYSKEMSPETRVAIKEAKEYMEKYKAKEKDKERYMYEEDRMNMKSELFSEKPRKGQKK